MTYFTDTFKFVVPDPQIMGTPALSLAAASTTQVINLPTGIQVGELLLIIGYLGSSGIVSTFTGWTAVHNQTGTGHAGAIVFKRIADGTEGLTTSCTVSASQTGRWVCLRIKTTTGDVEAATGASTNVSLTPSWGTTNTLWLVAYGMTVTLDSGTINLDPNTNYTEVIRNDANPIDNGSFDIFVASHGVQIKATETIAGFYSTVVTDADTPVMIRSGNGSNFGSVGGPSTHLIVIGVRP